MNYWHESSTTTKVVVVVSLVVILGSSCISFLACGVLGVTLLSSDWAPPPGTDGGTESPEATPTVVGYPDWRGEYFDNPDVNEPPALVRNDPVINFNWGAGPPAPGLPGDNYSVRWTRRAYMDEGNYYFRIDVEGGTRMWLDGQLLIDGWESLPLRSLDAESGPIAAGEHDLRIDYQKRTGNGQITARWEKRPAAATAPMAVVNGPAQAQVGQNVAFSGANSYAAEGGQIVGYAWDLGDGTTAQGAEVQHIYSSAGTFGVVLTVTDDKALTGSATHQIEITETAQTPEPTQGPVEPGLEGVEWMMDGALPGTVVSALFLDGAVSGSAGCNTYSGSYRTEGENLSIEVTGVTNAVCEEPVMIQEAEYLAFLQGAQSYGFSGARLQISSVVNELRVTRAFSPAAP